MILMDVFFILKRFLQNEILSQKAQLLLAGHVTLEKVVPLGHAVDLMLVLALTGALRQVSLGPLLVTSGQLLDTNGGVLTVVTLLIGFTSLSLGATMGHLFLVVETTTLITTVEVALHTGGIVGELVDPAVHGGHEAEPGGQHLVGELGQTLKTLERVAWWHLLVIGGGNGEKKCW